MAPASHARRRAPPIDCSIEIVAFSAACSARTLIQANSTAATIQPHSISAESADWRHHWDHRLVAEHDLRAASMASAVLRFQLVISPAGFQWGRSISGADTGWLSVPRAVTWASARPDANPADRA